LHKGSGNAIMAARYSACGLNDKEQRHRLLLPALASTDAFEVGLACCTACLAGFSRASAAAFSPQHTGSRSQVRPSCCLGQRHRYWHLAHSTAQHRRQVTGKLKQNKIMCSDIFCATALIIHIISIFFKQHLQFFKT
jgi:hypothetical protein